jgi:hypothetical protein
MEIAAREIKKQKAEALDLKPGEIGVIYLTPCPAKVAAINEPPRKKESYIDGAIAISDVYQPLLAKIDGPSEEGQEEDPVVGMGLGWPVLGGQAASLKAEDCLAVGGLNDVGRILDEIENGHLRDVQYVECQACPQGCCGGPLTVDNPYVARAKAFQLVNRYGRRTKKLKQKVRRLYHEGFFSLPGAIPATPFEPLDQDLSVAIRKRVQIQETFDQLPGIDCGACGSPTCQSFAKDVALDRVHFDECVVLKVRDELEPRPPAPDGGRDLERIL